MERANLQRWSEQHEGFRYGAVANIMDMKERGRGIYLVTTRLLASHPGTWAMYVLLGELGKRTSEL